MYSADVRIRFVVEDDKYNYASGRYPADAQLLAEKAIAMVIKAPGV